MLIIQCWYWQEKSSICLHRNLCLGAHLRREMDTIKGKMQAKKRALERNRLDVRFEDYLIQLFSCQSDKGDALNQVTTRREKQTLCFFVSDGRRAFNTWLNQFISIKTQFQFQDRRISPQPTLAPPPFQWPTATSILPNSLPPKRRHDVALLLQTSLSE